MFASHSCQYQTEHVGQSSPEDELRRRPSATQRCTVGFSRTLYVVVAVTINDEERKNCRVRSKSRLPATLRDSCGECPSDSSSELFMMWMVVWEARQEHAESTHFIVKIQIPNSLLGSVEHTKIGPVLHIIIICCF